MNDDLAEWLRVEVRAQELYTKTFEPLMPTFPSWSETEERVREAWREQARKELEASNPLAAALEPLLVPALKGITRAFDWATEKIRSKR